MKKLMTTVSAVALALGLYATDTGTSFEGLSAGDYDITATTGELTAQAAGESYWDWGEVASTGTLTVVAGTSTDVNNERPDKYKNAAQQKYLSIKTTLGNPVTRNVSVGGAGTAIGSGFYFDSLVKFTAFDEDQAIDLNGGKIAIWLRENYVNEEPVSTNLMITAGYLDASLADKAFTTNYECSVAGVDINDGGWHRVTVKAIENIYTTTLKVPGFVVFVDGQYAASVDYATNTKGIDVASLTQNAKSFHVSCNGALFPSADQISEDKTDIAAVQFDGQGDVDDLVFTPDAPAGMADYEFFTIKLGANVASVTYTDGTTTDTITEDTAIVYTAGLGVKFTNVVYSNGYMNAAATYATGVNVNDTDPHSIWYEPSAAEQWVQVNAVQAGATIAGGASYETAAAAFAAISGGTLGAGPFTVVLNTAATSGVELNKADASVILDLAGNNITAGALDAAAITLMDGTLLVTNSTVTVGEVNGYDDGENIGSAVATAAGALTIAGGIYNGAVDVSSATSLITGGSFSVNDNKDPNSETVPPAPNSDLAAAAAAAGNELIVGSGSASYYTVQEKVPTAWADLLGDPVDGAYTIDDTADLLALQRGVLLGFATSNVTFKQTANIDMTGVEGFWGIGWFTSSDAKDASITASGNIKFEGVYDGNNKTLSNVTIVRHNYAGIFNCIENATIRDLTVSNVTFSGTCSEEGFAVVGNAYTGCTIANVTSAGTWPAEMRHNAAGIVVRAQGNTTISGCVNNVALSTTSKRLGGILAFAGTAGTVSIQNCTNNAAVASTDGTRGVGGILASPEAGAGETAVVISGCADFGSETAGSSGYTGAIVGALWSSTHTYTDDGGNTFPAESDVCGYFNGKTVHGLAYAVDAGIDGFNYLTTVKQADLAAGNQYTLLANVAASETPVFTLQAAGNWIAFYTNSFSFAGTIAGATGLTVTPVEESGVITYTAAAAVYAITYELGGGTAGSGTATEYTYSAAAQTATIADPTCEGSNFVSWTISPVEVTISGTTLSIPAGQTGAITLTATWEAAGGSSYPHYIDSTDSKITGQYSDWKSTYSVADGDNNYEADFLLNVAPGLVGATLNATAVSISGTTVTIDINHAVNGYPYVKKAATVAGLASATPTAVTVVPADNIENGARITLTGESAAAQFYQIGVQSAPVAVPNAD